MALFRKLSIVSRLFRKATRTAKSSRSSSASTISISSDAPSSIASSSTVSDSSASIPPISPSPPPKRYAHVGVQTESLPCHVAEEFVVGSSSIQLTAVEADGTLVLYTPASCPTIPDEDTPISLHTSAIQPTRRPFLLPNLAPQTTEIHFPQSILIRGQIVFFLRRLGSGTYGTVLLAQSRADLFAVKTFPKRVYMTPGFEATDGIDARLCLSSVMTEQRALELLRKKANPFFPRETAFLQDRDFLYIIMTLYQRSLYDEIVRYITIDRSMRDETLGYWSAELVQAVVFLHSLGLYHMDIKPQNIMITDAGHLCLIDFGMTTDSDRILSTGAAYGTPGYDAPEIYKRGGYFETELFDAYAVGQVLADMYLAPNYKTKYHYPLEYFGDIKKRNPAIASIIAELTQDNPNLRRPVWHFLTHPALQPELPQGITSMEEFAEAYIIDSDEACVVRSRAVAVDMDVA